MAVLSSSPVPSVYFRSARNRIAYRWLVVLSVSLGMFMSVLDSTIVNVAVPTMRHQFHASLASVQWIVTVYMLTQAAVIPSAPFLAARFGSKRAYVWSLSSFILGSVLCGFAWNLRSLVVFRLLQGIGGGVLIPMVMTLLFQAFSQEERGKATSTMMVPVMFAPLLGPVLGGLLVTRLGWPWAFFINIPMGLLAVIIAQSVLTEDHSDRQARLDLAGLVLAGSGSATLLYALSTCASGGLDWSGVMAFLTGLSLLAIFVVFEIRILRASGTPLLNLNRLRDRAFTLSTTTLALQTAASFGTIFLIPTYLQSLRFRSALQSGQIQAAQALTTLLILPVAGRLADRLGPKPVTLFGTLILSAALAELSLLGLKTPFILVAALLVPVGIGSAFAGQATIAAMFNISKEEHSEVANGSAIISVIRATAAPMGVALFSSLVQAWSSSAASGVSPQSTMMAMHRCFVVGASLVAFASLTMILSPGGSRRKGLNLVHPD